MTYIPPESVKSTFIIGQQKREQFLQLKKAAKMFSSGQIFSFNPVQGAEISALDWAVSKNGLR
jgi:hypothetical protein